MTYMREVFESYFMTLVHPFRIHQQFRHHLPLPFQGGHTYRPLTLAESLGISWIFAILRGLGKIVLISFFLKYFVSLQSDTVPMLQEFVRSSSVSTYYFLLFSAALDIIFFPIGGMIMTEFWAWVIRVYSGWLQPDSDAHEIADQITTHALSSNVFSMIPVLGDILQPLLYYFLLYAGLRSNLEAPRSLAFVILVTPTVLVLMLLSLLILTLFCLAAL